jgi:[ribosomal protein S5]-alanine N-acetyltransferase
MTETSRRFFTDRLTIVRQTRAQALAMVEALSPEDRVQVSPDWLAMVEGPEMRGGWAYGFSVVLTDGGTPVGTGGFKAPPVDGMVEIAYAVEPAERGKGFASEIAKGLTAYAFSFPEVTRVRAHTLPDGIASQRALAGSGFAFVGEVNDPEDGLVFRYERGR